MAETKKNPSFTCPRCGRTTYNPKDVEFGYCGRCHDYTGNERTQRGAG